MGEVLRQFLVPQNFHAGPHHILHQGGGRQHTPGPHGQGKGGGGHPHSDAALFHLSQHGEGQHLLGLQGHLPAGLPQQQLGKHEGAECYCGLGGNRTENNDHLGIHIQVGHGLEMEIEVCAMDLDGRAVGECSETGTHTRACC